MNITINVIWAWNNQIICVLNNNQLENYSPIQLTAFRPGVYPPQWGNIRTYPHAVSILYKNTHKSRSISFPRAIQGDCGGNFISASTSDVTHKTFVSIEWKKLYKMSRHLSGNQRLGKCVGYPLRHTHLRVNHIALNTYTVFMIHSIIWIIRLFIYE